MRKYTINFPVQRPGKETPFDFITEIWWDNSEAMRTFHKSDDYKNIIQQDEAKLGGTGFGVHCEEYVQR